MNHSLPCSLIWFSCCFIFHLCSTVNSCRELVPETNVPAVFAFGDAMTDTGNNNDLITIFKSNFPPYGKDFAQGKPTGRLSNGRILSDFLVEALGVQRNMPAYLDPNLQEKDLLTGVSFASTADQLKMFEGYIGKVKALVGNERTNYILNNSIYYVEAGSHDLVVYFDFPFRRIEFDVDSYTDFMLLSATSFIKKLYRLGARKFSVQNIMPIGCMPAQRTVGGGLGRECAEEHNQATLLYNTKLAAEVEVLEAALPGSKLVYVDIYSIISDITKNAASYGFKVVDKGCCGSGLVELGVLCNPVSPLCENRTEYFYWDSLFFTEKGYQVISNQIVEKYLKF